jgi:hypothetical protein
MTRTDEGMTPEHEDDIAQDERDREGLPSGEYDPAHNAAPPGNPETDGDAVEKGEEQIGRVVGR